MKCVLFVQPDVPEATFGTRKRMFHLTIAAAKAGYKVHILTPVAKSDILALEALKELKVVCHSVVIKEQTLLQPTINQTSLGKIAKRIGNAISFRAMLIKQIIQITPSSIASPHIKALHKALVKLLSENKYDVVVIVNASLANLSSAVPKDVPIVLDAHNVHYSMAEREFRYTKKSCKSSLIKIKNYIEIQKLKRVEKQIINRYDAVVAMSRLEAQNFARLFPSKELSNVYVIENGVDVEQYQSHMPHIANRIVFTGLMGYEPNADAVRWFLQYVWPLVLQAVPKACFDIVGANPPSDMYYTAEQFVNTVTLTGWVDDVRPYLERANIVVAPLHLGGGTRLKILEAVAMKRPVIATTVAAEGLDGFADGKHILLRDSPEAFAEAIVLLLSKPSMAQQLAEAANAVVQTKYNWEVLGRKQSDLLEYLTTSGFAGNTKSNKRASYKQ